MTTSRAASDEPVVPRPTEPVATSRAAPAPDCPIFVKLVAVEPDISTLVPS